MIRVKFQKIKLAMFFTMGTDYYQRSESVRNSQTLENHTNIVSQRIIPIAKITISEKEVLLLLNTVLLIL